MSVTTYHCLCAELILATISPLDKLPTRSSDNTYICRTASGEQLTANTDTVLKNVSLDSAALIMKLEDGFEKRYLAKCGRCGVVLGYGLDESLFEGSAGKVGRKAGVLYLLKGGVMETGEMESGKVVTERDVEVKVG